MEPKEIEEAQRVARLDQVGAAMRVWSETLAAARDQLVKAGFTRDEAVSIATQWVALVIAHNLGQGRVA
jgi:hypothetical protein